MRKLAQKTQLCFVDHLFCASQVLDYIGIQCPTNGTLVLAPHILPAWRAAVRRVLLLWSCCLRLLIRFLIAGCCYTSVHDSSRTFAADGSALIGWKVNDCTDWLLQCVSDVVDFLHFHFSELASRFLHNPALCSATSAQVLKDFSSSPGKS